MGPEIGNPEVVCQSDKGGQITSGGGFSTYFASPSWQSAAVSRYFSAVNSSSATNPKAGYNPQGRGFPDVALLGVNYQVYYAGQAAGVYGTSASAPVFAAIVTLLNTARKASGQTNIGFINPTLYSIGSRLASAGLVYHDVTSGNNKCCSAAANSACCQSGFVAAAGWDPVTGWGSVNYKNLAAAFNVTAAVDTTSAAPSLSAASASGISLICLLLVCFSLLEWFP